MNGISRTLTIFIAFILVIGCSKQDTVTDIDGNVYQTVQIGDQVWMAENLRVTHYRDGTAVTNVTGNDIWKELELAVAYCYYNNDSSTAELYGALYNLAAIHDSRTLAPAGWHIPTDDEWKELEMYLGMRQEDANETAPFGYYPIMSEEEIKEYEAFRRGVNEGSKLASHAELWEEGELTADSKFGSSGFNALPSGFRGYDFYDLGEVAYFWTASKEDIVNGWARKLDYKKSDITREWINWYKGLSVRCIKNKAIDYSLVEPFSAGSYAGDGLMPMRDTPSSFIDIHKEHEGYSEDYYPTYFCDHGKISDLFSKNYFATVEDDKLIEVGVYMTVHGYSKEFNGEVLMGRYDRALIDFGEPTKNFAEELPSGELSTSLIYEVESYKYQLTFLPESAQVFELLQYTGK